MKIKTNLIKLARVALAAGAAALSVPSASAALTGYSSGDLFLAFSTANTVPAREQRTGEVTLLANEVIDPLFLATVRATEEAIVNALVAGETMKGRDDHVVLGLPHDRLREILKKYGRLVEK